jgi:hypothetical protein
MHDDLSGLLKGQNQFVKGQIQFAKVAARLYHPKRRATIPYLMIYFYIVALLW